MNQDAIEHAAAAASAASAAAKASTGGIATYVGSLSLIGSWLVSSQAGVLVGLLVGITGLAVQWYYRAREFRLRKREHVAAMRQAGIDVPDPGE